MVVIAPQFLLDSSVLIEALRRASPDLQAHLARHEGRLATSTVVVSELYFGAARANDPELGRSQAERLLELVTVLDLDRSAADHAAQIRADLARKGTPIGPFDVLIAGHARSRGLTVVTAVKGQSELPSGGHESCPLTVTRSARWWPRDLPKGVVATTDQGGQFNGLTP